MEDFSNQLSSSLFVSSPRNTVGAFMTENRSHPLERAPAESLSLGVTESAGQSALINTHIHFNAETD